MLPTLLLLAVSTPPPDLVALGIVLSPRQERCVAVLRAEGRTRIVGVGSAAFGGRVAEIGPRSVALQFESGRVDVPLAGADAAPPPRPRAQEPEALRPYDPPEDPTTPVRAMDRREL